METTKERREAIDVVITWVDGNDPAWLEQKRQYSPKDKQINLAASHDIRFREWDNIKYIFRGIESFMPWVNNIYFITWGHLPKWLNTNHEKLRIVRHDEYIPAKYLPTFNSDVIELNMHRIKGLSEYFINFNDDTFVIGPTKKEDFFQNGKPRTEAILSPYPVSPNGIACTEMNNLEIINKYFSVGDIRKNIKNWICPMYGKKGLRTLAFLHAPCIFGILEPHTQLSLTKSTLANLWEKEHAVLDNTCNHRFRSKEDVNIWLVRHWQLLEGNFIPRRSSFGRNATLPRDYEIALKLLSNPGRCRLLCINDSLLVDDFESLKQEINSHLDHLLPVKSKFEL